MNGRFATLGPQVEITLRLKAEGPILVKGPDAMSALRPDMAFIRYPTGEGEEVPFLPGSSLKGVLRSGSEAFLRALGMDICPTFGNESCGGSQRKDRERCYTCLLFGSTRGAGVVTVRDGLPWPPGTAPEDRNAYRRAVERQTAVRQGVGIDRRRGAAQHGVLYDFEVLVDTTFFPTLLLRNPDAAQVSVVAAALHLLDEGILRVGSGTTRGLGRVHVLEPSVRVMAPTSAALTELTRALGPAPGRPGAFDHPRRHGAWWSTATPEKEGLDALWAWASRLPELLPVPR